MDNGGDDIIIYSNDGGDDIIIYNSDNRRNNGNNGGDGINGGDLQSLMIFLTTHSNIG